MGNRARGGHGLAYRLAPATLAVGLILLLGTVVSGAGPLASPADAQGAPLRASAAVTPHVGYLGSMGDPAGTALTFTIASDPGGRPVSAVWIGRPSWRWIVRDCPQAPSGWAVRGDERGCRYWNPDPAGAGDLAPGASSSAFRMAVATREGAADRAGTFGVYVASARLSGNDDDDLWWERLGGPEWSRWWVEAASAEPGGLDVTVYSFEVVDVVVAASPVAPGSACPPASRAGAEGEVRTLVVCGRNHTDRTLTLDSQLSSLRGSFVGSPGTFSSGPILGRSTSSVVLAVWDGVRIGAADARGEITATVGASRYQTSPPLALEGFRSVGALVAVQPRSGRPVARAQDVYTREDAPVAVMLAGTDPGGTPVTTEVATPTAHGTLTGTAPNLTYTPERDWFGQDSFTFTASDGRAISAPATVTVVVDPVNDPPTFTGGRDVTVPVGAGPQRIPSWATGISAGPANESSQRVAFTVTGDTNPQMFEMFAGPPAVSTDGTLTFTPAVGSAGTSTITVLLKDDGGTDGGGVDASQPFTFGVSVRGPTLTALSPQRFPSGPPGVGLQLAGQGYGDCREVYFFFDGHRIGAVRPDPAGRVGQGFAVPGDAEPGRHAVGTSCQPAGRQVQVRTTFDVLPADLHRSVVMTSLPKPGDVDLSPKSVAASMAGAIALILLVAFPGGLLDATLDEHYDEVRAWFGLRPKPDGPARELGRVLRILRLVVFLAVGGVAGAFLDSRFGLNESTLALALGLAVALGVVILGFELPGITYRRTRHREWGRLVFRPGALVLTAVLVGASRLLHLQPGYLFGLLGGLAFATELRQKAEGRLTIVSCLFILAVALGAWFLWVPVSAAASAPGANVWLLAAEAALGGIFVAGIEGLVVGLLPLREMDGSTLKTWNLVDWIVVYGIAGFLYVLIILRPAATAGTDSSGQMGKVLIVAGIFAVFSIAFWAWFHFREEPEEALPQEVAPAAG